MPRHWHDTGGAVSTIEQPSSLDRPDGRYDWSQVQASADFVELRRRLRRFVFPMTVAFLAWYMLYVLLATYARGFMAEKIVGNINVGLVLGLLQFVTTFMITSIYVRYANQRLDPLAERIRADLEDGDRP
jgi:uncharacterized membrane protein (DUF485 family)